MSWRTVVLTGLFMYTFAGLRLGAEDVHPARIPLGQQVVSIARVAVLPNAAPGELARPTVLTQDPRGRIFVNDLSGPIYYLDEASVVKYLDLRDYPELAIINGFHGLQSFAFHPDFFNANRSGFGCLYVLFSSVATLATPDFSSGTGTKFHSVLLEWRTNDPAGSQFDPADQDHPYRELLRINQPLGGHVGGLIAFNPTVTDAHPDYGNLYLAMGDGAQGGDAPDPLDNAQNPATPYGAILRINPGGSDSANGRYGIVMENVYASDNDPETLAEVYCKGLRNPQRFSWDYVTTTLYIADIGHDVMEEISIATNGGNFGWPIMEGSYQLNPGDTSDLTLPVAEYDHTRFVTDPQPPTGNRGITIGEVARGTRINGLDGHLLVADFPTGILLLLNVESGPLTGGQEMFTELLLTSDGGEPVRFLDIINAERASRGLTPTVRADLRFSVNTAGQIFLINKQDSVVRRLIPNAEIAFAIARGEGSQVDISFTGILQSTEDLQTWMDIIPQPRSPYPFDPLSRPTFFKSR